MKHRPALQRALTITATAALAVSLGSAVPAYAASCTVNVYRVNTAKGGSYVYVSYKGRRKVYKDPKRHNSRVTGPNKRVMNPNKRNGRRAVYLANGRIGWMYAPVLVYRGCK